MENNENKQNVNVNEQNAAQVENNNEKKSWGIGTAISAIKNTAGAVAGFVKEHKTGTAITLVTVAVSTVVLVALKKGKVEEPAVDADGFDNK